eukprot:scaffold1809_cov386-Prasinococcus_capsulatus_cf.AAC.16
MAGGHATATGAQGIGGTQTPRPPTAEGVANRVAALRDQRSRRGQRLEERQPGGVAVARPTHSSDRGLVWLAVMAPCCSPQSAVSAIQPGHDRPRAGRCVHQHT